MIASFDFQYFKYVKEQHSICVEEVMYIYHEPDTHKK